MAIASKSYRRLAKSLKAAPPPYTGRERSSDANANWERLRDLYEIARRRALHSEKVVSDLLASLDKIA